MLPYSEADLFERSKVGLATLLERDEAEFGTWCNATRVIGFSEITDIRQKERKLHLQRNPHHFCEEYTEGMRNATLPMYNENKALDHVLQVNILRVCRQIYIEANPVLWSTNTWALNNYVDFTWFMADRTGAQKASIKGLLLDLSPNSVYARSQFSGPNPTANGIMASFVSLRTLHLYLQDASLFRIFQATSDVFEIQGRIQSWRLYMRMYSKRFIDFKRLPLAEVTVLMPEHIIENPPDVPDWYHAEKIQYVESVRQVILDPWGFQHFWQEQALKRAEAAAAAAYKKSTK